jgi:hypothetical protein
MAARYGVRLVRMKEQLPDGQTITVEKPFDFRDLQGMDLRLEVEVGAASYWSELTETATLSNLFSAGAFGPKTYMKNLPRGALANRNSILEDMEAEERAQIQAGGALNAVP